MPPLLFLVSPRALFKWNQDAPSQRKAAVPCDLHHTHDIHHLPTQGHAHIVMASQRDRGKAYMEEADKVPLLACKASFLVPRPDQTINPFYDARTQALKRFALFSSSQKYEDASEAYTKAGNCFKVAKAWAEGGGAFTKASELHVKLGSTYDAANAAQEAGQMEEKSG